MTERTQHQIGDAEYAAALAAGRAQAETEIRAQAVRYVPEQNAIEILTTRGAGFLVPRQWIGALEEIPAEELARLTVWPDGSAIELEGRDIQVSVHDLMAAVLPAMLPVRALAAIFASRGGMATTAAKRRSAKANGRLGGRPSLHGEIAALLEEQGGMTTTALAAAIRRRGRYRKHNGTAVTPSQIAARVSRYPQLFERRGAQVRLKRG
ncbi:MAG: DUF2442 domain-containing protein [Steroidobacteraceae bacterium]